MKKFKVVITDCEYENLNIELDLLNDIAEIIYLDSKDEEKIIRHTADCNALIVQYAHVNKKIISNLNHCKIIAKYATSIDGIDLGAAKAKGITVTNVSDYCTEEVATHLVGFIIAISKQLFHYTCKVKEGHWYYSKSLPMKPLSKCTIGFIGFGKITRQAIQFLTPFTKSLWVYSNSVSVNDINKHGGLKKSFTDVVKNSDFLILFTPLNKDTEGLIDESVFNLMKPDAYLINMSRGRLINEEDLINAIKNKKIAGAALDVLSSEPIKPDNPLLTFKNVIITPHVAWYSTESIKRLQYQVANDVKLKLLGRSPNNIIG